MKTGKRMVVFPMADEFVEGQGYRIGVATEGESGFRPTGTWPYTGAVGETMPWFWGPTFADAQKACDEYNTRAGISKEEATKIILGTMARREN